MLTFPYFGDGGACKPSGRGGNVAEVVCWLEEGFALVADAAHLL